MLAKNTDRVKCSYAAIEFREFNGRHCAEQELTAEGWRRNAAYGPPTAVLESALEQERSRHDMNTLKPKK